MNLKLHKPLCVFDLETTGINISKDRIVEICILKVFPDASRESKTWYVNPEMPIPAESTAVHGITDEDVKDSPTFKELAPKIIDLIKDILTMDVDKIFNYNTIANTFGKKISYITIGIVLLLNALFSVLIVAHLPHINYLSWYFSLSVVFFIIMSFPILTYDKSHLSWVINFFRIWVFVGVIFMLLNGFFERF